jgi:putative membrane protein
VPHLTWWAWWTPSLVVPLGLIGLLYAWATAGPGRTLFPDSAPPTRRQWLSWLGALAAVYVSLGSPIGVLAMTRLFSAHMVQHMVAALVVPPLVIQGVPPWLWRALLRPRAVEVLFDTATKPLVAILVFNIVFSGLVAPPIITAMVQSMSLMVLLHVLLIVVGVVMWWPLLSPLPERPPLHPGFQLLYLFLNGIPMIMPLAIVALDTSPLYGAAYGADPRLWGLSLVADQQLGGILCLVGVHTAFGTVGFSRFGRWARAQHTADLALEGRRDRPLSEAPPASRVIPFPGSPSESAQDP